MFPLPKKRFPGAWATNQYLPTRLTLSAICTIGPIGRRAIGRAGNCRMAQRFSPWRAEDTTIAPLPFSALRVLLRCFAIASSGEGSRSTIADAPPSNKSAWPFMANAGRIPVTECVARLRAKFAIVSNGRPDFSDGSIKIARTSISKFRKLPPRAPY